MRHRLAVFITAFSLVSTLFVAVDEQAHAGVPQAYVTVSKPYVQNWVFRSAEINACMFVEITGTLVATHRYAYYATGNTGWDPNWYVWYNMKLQNPKVTMKGWPRTSTGCDSTKTVTLSKATLKQSWYEGSCHLSVAISVGAPWSIAAEPTYSCSTRNVATRKTTYAAGTSFAQANSGYPAYFSGEILAAKSDAIPVRGNVQVIGYRTVSGTNVSDAFYTSGAVAYMKG